MYNGQLPETDDSAETPRECRPNQQLGGDATQTERVRVSPTGHCKMVRPTKRGCEVDDPEDCSRKGCKCLALLFSGSRGEVDYP
jgi:hypothetical protein